jgi:stage V sporulation protein AC
MKKKTYKKYADAVSPRSPLLKDCLWAFFVGGGICCVGQGLTDLYRSVFSLNDKDAALGCSVTLVFVAALLTGIGVFDNIARHAGAGTLVPITGFANSVVSPAIDSRSEGLILGVGAKIFTVAGPVLLYGTLAGVLYGVIYYFAHMAFGV